jgi:hypothetical protein
MMKLPSLVSCAVAVLLAVGPGALAARAQGGADDLAKQVANPLASLVSVPLQWNQDGGIGPWGGERSLLNVQPVVPFAVGEGGRWKVIVRTVVPLVLDAGAPPAGGSVSGLGDATLSAFVTRVSPSRGGWLLGAGPVLQAPTGTERLLTTERWSAGPTAVALRQAGPWTCGVLANHLWSVSVTSRGNAVSATFAQPFVNYVTPTRTTFALNTEATYDWRARAWSVPVHGIVNQLLKIGPQPLSVFAGARYWAASPGAGPSGWGLRFGATLLFVPSPR